jgi:hypothetical protein
MMDTQLAGVSNKESWPVFLRHPSLIAEFHINLVSSIQEEKRDGLDYLRGRCSIFEVGKYICESIILAS